jgi:pyruvate formate lyase activating enzyme
MKGIISNIQRFSLHDGPGIRTTVFFQGCPLKCWWCHNPECIPLDRTAKGTNGYTVDALYEELIKDKIFFDESGGGVTFSGGEPMLQALFLQLIVQKCKKKKIHTAIDTSGFSASCVMEDVAFFGDLILYDLKLIDNKLHKKYTGVSNEKMLTNIKTLDKGNANVIIRIPLIPEITDTKKNIKEISEFLGTFQNNYQIDLIPYHFIAEDKYRRIKMDYKLKGARENKKRTVEIKEFMQAQGLNANIGS